MGDYTWASKYYQLSWWRKLATVKSLNTDVSSISPLSGQRNGATLLVGIWCPSFSESNGAAVEQTVRTTHVRRGNQQNSIRNFKSSVSWMALRTSFEKAKRALKGTTLVLKDHQVRWLVRVWLAYRQQVSIWRAHIKFWWRKENVSSREESGEKSGQG